MIEKDTERTKMVQRQEKRKLHFHIVVPQWKQKRLKVLLIPTQATQL